MIEQNSRYKDPDALLQMVQDIASTQEFTPETMNRMEELELALASFVEETSAALMEQELGQPKPPPIPPPGALLGMEATNEPRIQEQIQPRDLMTDLRQAGSALEVLQERLRLEEEALLQAELALQQQQVYDEDLTYDNKNTPATFEEDVDLSFEEQDILLQAEEALKKSREAAEKRRLKAEKRSVNDVRLSAGYRKQQLQEQVEDQKQKVERLQDEQANMETVGGANVYREQDTPSRNQQDVPRTKKRPTMELRNLFEKENGSTQRTRDETPAGLPILYNWTQGEDGIITGNIKGSMNFRDGAKISTSCVLEEATGGSIVATESGSR